MRALKVQYIICDVGEVGSQLERLQNMFAVSIVTWRRYYVDVLFPKYFKFCLFIGTIYK